MAASPAAPGTDRELEELLAGVPLSPVTNVDLLERVRPYASAPVEPLLEGRPVERREFALSVGEGVTIAATVIAPLGRAEAAPCIYWLHGGGMIMGDRFSQIDIPLEWLDQLGAVVVSVDYRLAPEVAGTTLVEDAYAGLVWVVEHADELGIDTERIVVAGTSAGGGIAAGVTLMARDRGGPTVSAQMLICPMLDHRGNTTSSHQYTGGSVWPKETNEFAWSAVLGGAVDDEVSAYVSPSRATDVSGLPPAYIDAGTAEVFRDEDVAYASAIWAAGGQAELHVWAGGFHGFDALFPTAQLSVQARQTRSNWLARVLGSTSTSRSEEA
jgi:acetyl esterase/lipase